MYELKGPYAALCDVSISVVRLCKSDTVQQSLGFPLRHTHEQNHNLELKSSTNL